jgi:hypothetical protein
MRNQVTPMSYDMDTMLRMPDRQMAEQRLAEENAVRAYNRALCIDWKTPASETTLACPARNKRKVEEVEWDVAPRRVKVSKSEQEKDSGSGSTCLADWKGKTPLASGVWHNGAFNNAPHHEMSPGWTTSQYEQERRATVTQPGSQPPGVTVSGVALHLPHLKLQPDNQDATASEWSQQKISSEVSAGTNLMAARKAASSVCCGI